MVAPKKIKAAERRAAVVRILGETSDTAKEASRLGVDIRSVQRWVDEAKKKNPDLREPRPPAPAGSSSPPSPPVAPGQAPAETPSPMLEDARLAAGRDLGAPISAGEVARAQHEASAADVSFCLDAIGGLKVTATGAMAQMSLKLDPADPAVVELGKLGPSAEMAIRANASLLAPQLRRVLGGWAPLAIALGMDALQTLAGLRRLALERGTWKPQAPAPAPAAAAVHPFPPQPIYTEKAESAVGQILDAEPA